MLRLSTTVLWLVLLVTVIQCQSQQEQEEVKSCPGEGDRLLGFTALSPDQLRHEIRTTLQESLSESLDHLVNSQLETQLAFSVGVSALEELIAEVNGSLRLAEEAVVGRLEESLTLYVDRRMSEAVASLTVAFQSALASLTVISPPSTTDTPTTSTPSPGASTSSSPGPSSPPPTTLPPLPPPGTSPSRPASSCLDVLNGLPSASSGLYWITGPTPGPGAISVYCDMTRTCGNFTGGWMRVADVDLSDPSQECPDGFAERTIPSGRRLCTPGSDQAGCFPLTFPVPGPQYGRVCGRVVAYQNSTPNAFFPYHVTPTLTIDDPFVDGIVITHGSPRVHVWTFAAALDEDTGHLSGCQCSNVNSVDTANIPPYVGNNYFCDSGTRDFSTFQFFSNDPLWDGEGCGSNSLCCSFNNPPWFYRALTSPTSDDLELRVCRDAPVTNEDTPFEVVELYVR